MSELLTTRELQSLLKVDRITIYRMLHEGYLPGFKVGGQWRFRRNEIEAWLESQRDLLAGEAVGSSDFAPSPEALPLHCIEVMQGLFAEVLGIAAVTCDTDGRPLTAVSNSCSFCDRILSTTEGRRRCEGFWKPSGGSSDSPELRACHAGLLGASASIQISGDWVANVACCQFVSEAGNEAGRAEFVGTLAAELGLPREDLRAAAAEVRRLPEDAVSRIPHLLQRLSGTFAEIGEERVSLLGRLQRIAEMTKV